MTAADEPAGDSLGAAAGAFEVLVLSIGGSAAPAIQIAVPASLVREVSRADRITPYPGAPDDVLGVTAVRGRVVAVLNLAARAGDVAGDVSGVLVILDVEGRALALTGATPVRVATSGVLPPGTHDVPPTIALGSGRLLPLAGSVRLLDASRPDAGDGSVLPLLDAAALIDDAIDDPDGG